MARVSSAPVLAALLLLSLSLACDKGETQDAAAQPAEPTAGEAAKVEQGDDAKADGKGEGEASAGGAGVVALPELGLEGSVEGKAQVTEMMGSLMVQAEDLTVTVEAGDDKPKTGEEAQAAAADRSPVDPKLETLPDGYVLTFTNEGALGTNYWVEVRREIAGKAAWCTTTAHSQAQADAAVAFCRSLRVAG